MPVFTLKPSFNEDTMQFRYLLLLMASITLPLAGCSSGDMETYPVRGTVKYQDGSPLTGGEIVFSQPGKARADGVIKEDGTFELGTYAKGDGAPPGKYEVSISTYGSGGSLHQKYADARTSGLSYTVTEGDNHFDIKVDKGPK